MGLEALVEAALYVELQAEIEALARKGQENTKPPAPVPDVEFVFQNEFSCITTGTGTAAGGKSSTPARNDKKGKGKDGASKAMNKRKKEIHCKQVKEQRAHMKGLMELLQRELPVPQPSIAPEEKALTAPADVYRSKFTTLMVLKHSVKLIKELKEKERDFEVEIERLKSEKASLEERLAFFKGDVMTAIGVMAMAQGEDGSISGENESDEGMEVSIMEILPPANNVDYECDNQKVFY